MGSTEKVTTRREVTAEDTDAGGFGQASRTFPATGTCQIPASGNAPRSPGHHAGAYGLVRLAAGGR
jgi:hypothetical protein